MTIEPLEHEYFMENMKASENVGDYSEDAVRKFSRWMYSHQDGIVQVCAFPVPSQGETKSDLPKGKWIHSRSFNELEDFCRTHSGLWVYHVYAGVNTLSQTPSYGRGSSDVIDTINILSLDIELSKDSYTGSTKQEVWWTYQLALAEIKYMAEEYNAWPMVVMSENGIHLHYRVYFDCTDELLYNNQHVYSKYLTEQAMNNKYTSIIKSKAPHSISFDQDDVSDPARVMKVPGTKGIKSDKGRLCGIIHKPSSVDAGLITESDIDYTVSELKTRFEDSSSSSSNNGSGNVSNEYSSRDGLKSVDTTPSDLSDDTRDKVMHLVRNDNTFSQYWNGDVVRYDSRSEMEFAFIIKLLNHGFSESEIVEIMWSSGMSKWNEESDHYREKTLYNAIDYFDGSTVKDSKNGSFSFSDR